MALGRLRRPGHSTVVAYVALVVAMGGTAAAATGGTFVLGQANSAGHTTALTNHGTGAALRLAAHNLTTPALSVGRNHTRIPNLNADFLDGLTSARLQRRVTGSCANGSAIRTVHAGGGVACGPRILWAVVNADGTLARSTGGVASAKTANGQYAVTFPVDVHACAYTADSGLASAGTASPIVAAVAPFNGNAKGVAVDTYPFANGAFGAGDAAFHLLVVC